MHHRVYAADIARTLTTRGHNNSLTGTAWQPGHHATQASPTTVRLWHDGHDEAAHLNQYADVLRADGCTVTAEQAAGKRPSLRGTRQPTKKP